MSKPFAIDRTVACKTLDCANKLRVHYFVPRPLARDFLACFPDDHVTMNEFSQYVAGAKDHFSILRHNRVHAGGVMGEQRLVVTYLKAEQAEPIHDVADFERILEEAGFGTVLYRQVRNGRIPDGS